MTKNNEWFCRANLRASARRFVLTAGVVTTLASAAGTVLAAGPERSLGGISIFASGSEVTRKFGNPSRILVGGVAPGSASSMTGGGAGASGGMGGAMTGGVPGGMGGGMPGGGGPGLLPGLGTPMGGGGAPGGFPGMGGGMPGMGGGFPNTGGGFPGTGGFSGMGGSNGAAAAPPPKPPVTLIYDRANGGSLEFTISPDKRVIQIRETGYNGAYGTSRGIRLGVKYSDVIAHYGYPENTYIEGAIIDIDYKDTLHCGFQFLDQKLVGIIIASPD